MVLMLMAFIGYTARPAPATGCTFSFPGAMPGRYLVGHVAGASGARLPDAFALGGSAYAERYTGISLPPFLLLAGLGHRAAAVTRKTVDSSC